MGKLGKWAVIDIETTGIDANYDEIIDIGYLQFDGTQLVKTYSSLVYTENKLSEFIQKLTGIQQQEVNKAPHWSKVEPELLELDGHHLLAHNAAFENNFLSPYFEALAPRETQEFYQDSIHFLGLLYPNRATMNLESFLIDMKIAEKELHRGLSDSMDMLKVILLATFDVKKDVELTQFLKGLFYDFKTEDFWFKEFFALEEEGLIEIAHQIDFDLVEAWDRWRLNNEDSIDAQSSVENLEFSGSNIKAIFEDESNIRQFLPYYSFRQSQEDLALRVGQAFNNNIHALVQAPTGTGKTLGYMIPAALFAVGKDEKVLLSTGTKTLQSQAYFKDVPLLKKLLGMEDELRVTKLIGSGNHYCELKYRNENTHMDLITSYESTYVKNYFDVVFFHNQRNEYDDCVSRENYPFIFKRIFKSFAEEEEEYAVDYKSCTNSRCPFYNQCSYVKGLRKAKESHLIISNHAMTMAWPRSFERPQYVVMDEAHKLEGEATRAFTMEVREKDLVNYSRSFLQMMGPLFYLLGQDEKDADVKRLREMGNDTMTALSDQVPLLRDNIEKFFKSRQRYTDIFWNESPMLSKEGANDMTQMAIINQLESIKYILESSFKDLVSYWSTYNLNEYQGDDAVMNALSAFESFMSTLEEVTQALSLCFTQTNEFSRSIKFHEEYGYLLEASPVDVGKIVYDHVLQQASAVVMTSATLANAKGDRGIASTEWMTGYAYLEPEKRFKTGLFLPEVYDVENKAKVFISTDVPSLYDSEYVPTVLNQIVPTIKYIGGRTLLLYSARKRFEQATELLLNHMKGDIPVFVQGMGQNVVEEFKASPHGILVGMESFGEGIDIPGEKLQLVVIDKVPDLRQDYVIQKRRDFYQREFGNEFNDYFLGSRARSLHQKLGRLLRTVDDFGAVIITDSRLKRWKKSTLGVFRGLMEPYQLEFTDLEAACEKSQDFIFITKKSFDNESQGLLSD
jgi:ATP-dependent DNA helicase DinG